MSLRWFRAAHIMTACFIDECRHLFCDFFYFFFLFFYVCHRHAPVRRYVYMHSSKPVLSLILVLITFRMGCVYGTQTNLIVSGYMILTWSRFLIVKVWREKPTLVSGWQDFTTLLHQPDHNGNTGVHVNTLSECNAYFTSHEGKWIKAAMPS